MKNRLNWYVDSRNMWGNPVVYRANFMAQVTDSIEIYIAYTISLTPDNNWQFSAFYYSPKCISPMVKTCQAIEDGKKMAEEHLKGIFDGMKKLLDN